MLLSGIGAVTVGMWFPAFHAAVALHFPAMDWLAIVSCEAQPAYPLQQAHWYVNRHFIVATKARKERPLPRESRVGTPIGGGATWVNTSSGLVGYSSLSWRRPRPRHSV